MALKDTFTIQEISLDEKDLAYDIKLKELEICWNKDFQSIQERTIAKLLVINTLTFRYSYA